MALVRMLCTSLQQFRIKMLFARFCVFLYKNVVRIRQSIQNQPFRVGLQNDKNDSIQKDEIR